MLKGLAYAALATMAVLVLGACTTPTPSPSPTATIVDPIVLDDQTDPWAFLRALPQTERECLERDIPAQRTESVLQGMVSQEEGMAVLDCVSQETRVRLYLGATLGAT